MINFIPGDIYRTWRISLLSGGDYIGISIRRKYVKQELAKKLREAAGWVEKQ